MFTKIGEFIKKHYKLLIIIGVIFIILIVSVMLFLTRSYRKAGKMVKYLEGQGYNCSKIKKGSFDDNKEYICTDRNGDEKRELNLTAYLSDDDFYMEYKLTSSKYKIFVSTAAYLNDLYYEAYVWFENSEGIRETIKRDGEYRLESPLDVGDIVTLDRTDIYDKKINEFLREFEEFFENTGYSDRLYK